MEVERLDYVVRSAEAVLDTLGPAPGSPAAGDRYAVATLDASLRTSAAALERLRARACAMGRLRRALCEASLTPPALSAQAAPAVTIADIVQRQEALESVTLQVTDEICEQAVQPPDAEYRLCAFE